MMRGLLLTLSLLVASAASWAATPAVNPADLSFDENIETPVVPKKATRAIVSHMENIRATVARHGLETNTERGGEVVVVTIPCSLLFAPNSTEILADGEKYLRPFSRLLRYPTMYKVIVAVHSDNTGEADYLDSLTSARADAVDNFLTTDSGTNGESLVPYGLATDVPLNDNRSMAEREANRRLEIYIVPNTAMIETAKSGKL